MGTSTLPVYYYYLIITFFLGNILNIICCYFDFFPPRNAASVSCLDMITSHYLNTLSSSLLLNFYLYCFSNYAAGCIEIILLHFVRQIYVWNVCFSIGCNGMREFFSWWNLFFRLLAQWNGLKMSWNWMLFIIQAVVEGVAMRKLP